MTMADVDRLIAKMEELSAKLGQIHVDLEVLKSRGSSGEKQILDHESRLRIVEQKQADAAKWRAWMAGVAAVFGAALAKLSDAVLGLLGKQGN